jgi:hypothetical protein
LRHWFSVATIIFRFQKHFCAYRPFLSDSSLAPSKTSRGM